MTVDELINPGFSGVTHIDIYDIKLVKGSQLYICTQYERQMVKELRTKNKGKDKIKKGSGQNRKQKRTRILYAFAVCPTVLGGRDHELTTETTAEYRGVGETRLRRDIINWQVSGDE